MIFPTWFPTDPVDVVELIYCHVLPKPLVVDSSLEVSLISMKEVLPTCVFLFESEKSFISRISIPSVIPLLARV